MHFFLNDLSLNGQFHDLEQFQAAVVELMKIRHHIHRHGCSLSCHRGLVQAQITPGLTMQQVAPRMPRDMMRAWMQWVTKGPFWDDDRQHSEDDYLHVNDEIVTDSAIAEAAVRTAQLLETSVVSIRPSEWDATNEQVIAVHWELEQSTQDIDVPHHTHVDSLLATLSQSATPIRSWSQMAAASIQRCTHLRFSEDAFESLEGHPFAPSAAERVRVLLNTLEQLKCSFGEDGARNDKGKQIYQNHFTGQKAWFTDSSETEKHKFKDELTFRHPDKPGETLFCVWHGKVKTPQIRIHFSWPISDDTPVYVVYVGPKITKR